MASKRAYGLFILDYHMPTMNGDELLHRLHDMDPCSNALFITGHANINVVFPAMQEGAARVLSKPVDLEDLMENVGHYCLH